MYVFIDLNMFMDTSAEVTLTDGVSAMSAGTTKHMSTLLRQLVIYCHRLRNTVFLIVWRLPTN